MGEVSRGFLGMSSGLRTQSELETMKKTILFLSIALLSATALFAQDSGWPRQRVDNGNTLITYQPQIDDWKNFRELDWRMAFSFTPAGGKEVVGAMSLTAISDVDTENHMVLIHDLKITNIYFPSLDPGTAAQMEGMVRVFLPPSVSISLERVVSCVPKRQSVPAVQLRNDPPEIFVSYQPAVLLDVDGQPSLAPIEKTDVAYVVNTHWPVFLEKSRSQYFFLAGGQWMEASNLEGPWSAATKLPQDLEKLPQKDAHWADLANFVPPSAQPAAVIPAVLYSTRPAQIILFDGRPSYSQIPGTQLAYANNTESYLFRFAPTNQYFYLISGRWFSANNLGGPWTYATENLPPDFAQIPPSNPAAQVLPSVPGTEEAKDSVLMAQIPTTVIVNPAAAAQASVSYDGNPQFAPIEGTSLSYATNTAQKVIQLGDQYFLCFQGVWFYSSSPTGPWKTAPSVPQQIYTIPPSSPVYNVTYVTQVTNSDGNVQASSTAGYLGAFVLGAAVGAVIAGGTGYYYPPYVGVHVGYGYPPYYGTATTYGSSAYYHSATGAYGVSQTAYGPYGSASRSASYNPYTGTSTRTASASTPYGHAAAGTAYNPYTGAAAATRQGSNAYGSWGSSAVSTPYGSATASHQTTAQGSTGSMQTSAGGRAVGSSTAYGSSAAGKTSSGDLYASHDGNVYKNTGSGWQKYGSNGSWNSVNTPSQAGAQQKSQSYEQQHPGGTSGAQSAGQQRSQGSAQQRSSSSGGFGGGEEQGMHNEAQNRQRGGQSSQRFQQSRGGGGGGGGRRR
jgi:hypothetical protein